ncbi:hypothetical protein PGT21_012111 [Puccinia graminis f. sp. tritici]|uniref:Uncharacterized protein n=1 Tax=Puccinia graminis f. sp. tritici TaxID=56615 RepID=A0A5B0LK21_PUCGR|nr:hypothetical protein PGT21_012111 [Puccinia graminis f. sp. tritici]
MMVHCSYAPIYLFQHPDYCNFNLLLLAFIMVSGYGLLLLGNRLGESPLTPNSSVVSSYDNGKYKRTVRWAALFVQRVI